MWWDRKDKMPWARSLYPVYEAQTRLIARGRMRF